MRSTFLRKTVSTILATLLLAMAIPSAALASTTASEETEDIYALYYKNAAGNYTLVIQLGDQDNSAGKYGTYEPASTTLICGGEGNEEEGIEDLCHCFDWNSGSAPHASEITAVHVSKSPGLGYYVAPHALSGWFQGFTKCTTFDLSGLETGNARFMANAFQDCQSLRSFDFNTIDTSKAFNLTSMFEGCTSLESVNFAVDGSISFAYGMFKGCTSLKSIDTTSVNPVAIDRMDEMFMNCTSLKSANLSGIDTEYGSSATSVFSGCTALEEVNLSNFSTIDESGEYGLFSEYGNGIDNFFKGCSALKKIILGDRCDMSSVIPMPSSTFIPNATGKWVNEKGQAFSSRSIPGYTAGTYTAQVTTSTPSQNTKPTTPGGAAGNSTAPAKTSLSGATAKPAKSAYTYTGKAIKPGVTVKVGGKTLKAGTDYAVSYKSNRAVGTATVTVTGKGAYTGSKSATFKINPKGTSVKGKVAAGKKSFTVKWSKLSKANLKQATGYQIRYSLKKTMKGAKVKTVKATSSAGKKCALKVSKLKGGKKYYVQVRTYKKVGGKTYCSGWSKAKTVKVKK